MPPGASRPGRADASSELAAEVEGLRALELTTVRPVPDHGPRPPRPLAPPLQAPLPLPVPRSLPLPLPLPVPSPASGGGPPSLFWLCVQVLLSEIGHVESLAGVPEPIVVMLLRVSCVDLRTRAGPAELPSAF